MKYYWPERMETSEDAHEKEFYYKMFGGRKGKEIKDAGNYAEEACKLDSHDIESTNWWNDQCYENIVVIDDDDAEHKFSVRSSISLDFYAEEIKNGI